jgi:hypothetical protein
VRLFHLHIPKCGGISIRKMLAVAHGPIVYVNNAEDWRSKPGAAEARTISGHYMFGLREELGLEGAYFILLREPMARLASLARYIRAHPHHKLHRHLTAPGIGFRELLAEHPGKMSQFRNGQTQLIAGGPDSLEAALANLGRPMVAAGVLEALDEAVAALGRLVELAPAKIAHRNVSEGAGELSDEDVQALRAANANDFELYDRVLNGRL